MLGDITERKTTKTIYMETIYLISINSIASRIKGRAWRRWYNFKRTMARAINRWVYLARRSDQEIILRHQL